MCLQYRSGKTGGLNHCGTGAQETINKKIKKESAPHKITSTRESINLGSAVI